MPQSDSSRSTSRRRSPPARRRSPSRRRSQSRRRPPSRRRSPPQRDRSPAPGRRRARSRTRSSRRPSPPPRRGSRSPGGGGGCQGRARSPAHAPEAPESGGPAAETGRAEVVESKARQSTGELTYRAEILMPKCMRFNYDGKARTMCIRGPVRVDRDQAHRDAEELEKSAAGGDTSKVKAVARQMLQTNVL
mmetsp:Transcript_113454/g.321362  ORF Transcript_113454/g.321362 Transcript_113454/m.321362 type:complete len:191 (+) Transcript_113454:96-668(+)